MYICMAWEYESWKAVRNGMGVESLLQDGSVSTCDCGDTVAQGDEGLVAYLNGDRVKRGRESEMECSQ